MLTNCRFWKNHCSWPGCRNWSVCDYTDKFKTLCSKAFKPHMHVKQLRDIALVRHQGCYKSKPFQKVLQKGLGDDALFGGASHYRGEGEHNQTKVALPPPSWARPSTLKGEMGRKCNAIQFKGCIDLVFSDGIQANRCGKL